MKANDIVLSNNNTVAQSTKFGNTYCVQGTFEFKYNGSGHAAFF